jgi:hypothetical protein
VKKINKSDLRMPHVRGYLRVSKESNSTGSYTLETQGQRIIEFLNRNLALRSIKTTTLNLGE